MDNQKGWVLQKCERWTDPTYLLWFDTEEGLQRAIDFLHETHPDADVLLVQNETQAQVAKIFEGYEIRDRATRELLGTQSVSKNLKGAKREFVVGERML